MANLHVLTLLSAIIWVYLMFFRIGFWRADQYLGEPLEREVWPEVVAIIPARNEEQTIGRTVGAVLGQDYPGKFKIVVVNDCSDDDTAIAAGESDKLYVIDSLPMPSFWTGKLWAVEQGIEMAKEVMPDAKYIWLSDADIEHDSKNLWRLVGKAEEENRHLVSLMVKLRTESFWEQLLVPAFVFFFQKLYPFPAVNIAENSIAAAAGGCMLVRRESLDKVGGVKTIKSELIDDCALARQIKTQGSIWIGLTRRTQSLRACESLGEIWDMVARTAFVQLRYSLTILLLTIAGMIVIYIVPPIGLILGSLMGNLGCAALGFAAWSMMLFVYAPTAGLYNQSFLCGILLPIIAFLYLLMTVSSALRHWFGRGTPWKGRTYDADV